MEPVEARNRAVMSMLSSRKFVPNTIDPSAAEQSLPLVYEELRKSATAKRAQEKPGQTRSITKTGARLPLTARRLDTLTRGGGLAMMAIRSRRR